MVLKYLETVVHELRRRGLNADDLLRAMQRIDEANFDKVFDRDFTELVTGCLTWTRALNTFCDELIRLCRNDTLFWMICGAKEMGDNDLAYFIQSKIDGVYASGTLSDDDRTDIEPLMTSLAKIRIEKPNNYCEGMCVWTILRPKRFCPPRVDEYFARPDEEEQLQQAVRDMCYKPRGSLLVIGEGGIGKTSLITESIFYKSDFLQKCAIKVVIWLNVFQYSQDDNNGPLLMAKEIESALPFDRGNSSSRLKTLIILDDVFSTRVFSAALKLDDNFFIIAISRRKDVNGRIFSPTIVTAKRMSEEGIWEMFRKFNQNLQLEFKHGQLTRLAKLCSGLPLLARILMSKFQHCESEREVEGVYRKISECFPESIIDEKLDDEEKAGTISKLLLIGFEDETEQFRERYSAFLMFKEATNVALRDLAILWQCSDDDALEQARQFRNRSLVRASNIEGGMKQLLNIHAYLYASVFRLSVTATANGKERKATHLKFRETWVAKKLNEANKENLFHQAIKHRRRMLFDVVVEILMHPECDQDIFWKICTHRAEEVDTGSTPLHYLLNEDLFKNSDSQVNSQVPMPVLVHIVQKLLVTKEDLALSVTKTRLLSAMLDSVRDGVKWNQNALLTAANSGNLRLLELLLNNGANVNTIDDVGCTCLIKAAERNYYRTAEKLLEKGGLQICVNAKNKKEETALIVAARNGFVDTAKLLLDDGNACNVLLGDSNGDTALHHAVMSDQPKIVELLLTKLTKADVDKRNNNGHSALWWAKLRDNKTLINQLTKAGADLENCSEIAVSNDDSLTPLISASRDGHSDVVRQLLENKAQHIEAQSNEGLSPLMYASLNGHCDVVKLLLANKAEIEARDNHGWTPLMHASEKGHCDVVKLLLENKADIERRNNDGWTPLMYASRYGHCDVVRRLLENKADVEARDNHDWTSLIFASRYGHFDVAKRLLEHMAEIEARDNDGWTSLMYASFNGHCVVVKLLLENKADIDARSRFGWSSLILASRNGHCDIVQLLLENKDDIEGRGNAGWSPLMHASLNGHFDVVKVLLEGNANIEARNNDRWTSLMFASCDGHVDVLKLLLDSKADIEARSKVGWSPLIIASRNGHFDVVKQLLENNADVEARDNDGWTSMMHASRNGHCDVVTLLSQYHTEKQ